MTEAGRPFTSENVLVQKLLAGEAPEPVRQAAARGALPLTPEELFHVLHALTRGAGAPLAELVRGTLAGLADDTFATIVGGPHMNADLLDFAAHHALDKPATLAALIRSTRSSGPTLEFLAANTGEDSLELLVTNQVALIRHSRLIDTLLENPRLTPDQRRRVLEVREEFFHKKELEEQRRRDEEARLAKLREKKEWSNDELEALQDHLAREALQDKERGALPPDAEDLLLPGEPEHDSVGVMQRIMHMSVPEKVLLAIRGSRSERNVLIHDPNRLVATSAIKSPKITDKDVEYYAAQRNISDEILRIIGTRREWLRSYSVLHTLVKNPRTPLAIALNLLSRLQQRDLKNLVSDRNVSEQLRRQAKQLLDKLTRRPGASH